MFLYFSLVNPTTVVFTVCTALLYTYTSHQKSQCTTPKQPTRKKPRLNRKHLNSHLWPASHGLESPGLNHAKYNGNSFNDKFSVFIIL